MKNRQDSTDSQRISQLFQGIKITKTLKKGLTNLLKLQQSQQPEK